MTQHNFIYIASKSQGIIKVGDTTLLYTTFGCDELGIFLKADGRELWVADYPELAKNVKRTIMQRLRGVFTLPDLN